MNKSLSIGDTARITGITEKQLRNWEQRGYITGIQRVICGERAFRFYTEEQIDRITAMKTLLDQGYTLPVASVKALQNSIKEEE
jgi:DNA-binding transcriptional MerR regulator